MNLQKAWLCLPLLLLTFQGDSRAVGYTATWDGSNLNVVFGSGVDEVLLGVDQQGYIDLYERYGYPDQTYGRLVTNVGEIHPSSIARYTVDMGAGDDHYGHSVLPPTDVFTLYGGTGTNFVSTPNQAALAYYYGGPDYDDIELDQSPLVFCFTGDGGSAINLNATGTVGWIDLGVGSHSMHGNPGATTAIVFHPGSTGGVAGVSGDTTYILCGTDDIDNLEIVDNGGNDTLITQRDISVSGTTIVSDSVSGYWSGFPETRLQLAGDFNTDNTVDAADYAVLRKAGGSLFDYQLWRTGFGTWSSAAAGIPENICLLPAVLLLLIRRRIQ